MDSQYKSHGCEVRWRGLPYAQLFHLTRHILKQGMVALCGISLLCQQSMAVPMLSGNAVKQIHTSQVVAYHYDAWSRLRNRTLPSGVSTVYQYDEYGGVSNIIHYQTPHQQKAITGFTYIYNQDGSIRQRVRINGLGQKAIEQYGYDDDNNLKEYQCSGVLCPHDAQGKAIAYQHYTFDGFNNIKTVTSNNTLTTYEYDQQLPTRLIDYHNSNPAYPSSQKLRYDRNGNILQDDQGNVIIYDPLDKTHSVNTRQGITTYFYNGEGRQVGEAIPNRPTTYFIYGQSNLLNTRVGSQQTSFLYGANRLGKSDADGIKYYLTDQGQSVVGTVNQTQEQAQTINSYAYSPYGIESNLTTQPRNTMPTQHFGFDGQLTDSQTNWQFLGQGYRAYNPMLHRFMSQDSLSPFDKGGINGYVFGSNNPIMMSDPTGHVSFWANMGIGLVMGMAAGMLTSEMGGWGALAINALAGAVGSNIDAIDNAVSGKAINWKSVGINAGIGAALGALGGRWGRENVTEEINLEDDTKIYKQNINDNEINVNHSQQEYIAYPDALLNQKEKEIKQHFSRYIFGATSDATEIQEYKDLADRLRLNGLSPKRGTHFDMQKMHGYLCMYATSLTTEEREKYSINDFFIIAKAEETKNIENSSNTHLKQKALDLLKHSNSFYSYVELWEQVQV